MPIDWSTPEVTSSSGGPPTRKGKIDWSTPNVGAAPQEENPVVRRVKEASHQVAEDVRRDFRLPKTPMEGARQILDVTPIGGLMKAADVLNVPSAIGGGLTEMAARAGPKTAQGVPNLPGWLKTALNAINPTLEPAAEMAIMEPKIAGDIAQTVAPGPEGVAMEGAAAGGRLMNATRLALDMKIPLSEARQLIAAGKVPEKFVLGATKDERAASKQVLQRVRSDTSGKNAPTATQILEHASSLPREHLTPMDTVGARTKGYAGMIARGPEGSGGGTLKRFFRGKEIEPGSGRSAQLKPEMVAESQQSLGSGSSHETIDALRGHQREQSTPLYQGAFKANRRMPNAVFDEFKRDRKLGPLYRQAFDEVRARYKGKGIVYADKDSLEVYDAFKRKLWNAAQDAKKGAHPNTNLSDMYKEKYNQLVSELDKMDRSSGKLYAKARKVWGGERESMDAVEFGRDEVLSLTPYEIGKRFRKLSDNDQELARLGLAETIRKRIEKAGVGNPATFLAHDEYLKQQIRQMFKSPQDAEKFFDAAVSKDLQWRTATEVLGGSQTAERAAEDVSPAARAAGHAIASAAAGRHHGAMYHALRGAIEHVRRPKGGVGEAAADILTQRLSEPGTAARKILERRQLEEAARDFVKNNPPILKQFSVGRGLARGVPLAAGSALSQTTQ